MVDRTVKRSNLAAGKDLTGPQDQWCHVYLHSCVCCLVLESTVAVVLRPRKAAAAKHDYGNVNKRKINGDVEECLSHQFYCEKLKGFITGYKSKR